MKRHIPSCMLLAVGLSGCARRAVPPVRPLAPTVFQPLQQEIQKPYLELFKTAPTLEFSHVQIEKMRQYLKGAEDYCVAQFERRGDELRVVTEVRININLLGMNVYEFEQRIEESWSNGLLMGLISVAVDDGDTRNVKLARKGDRLVGSYDGKKRDLPGHLLPSTLWNSAVVEHSSVLETSKGRERTFKVTQEGIEEVALPIGTVKARHFVFTGKFNREAWYDESGVLVAAQMEAKDGSIIRQELLRAP